MKQTPYQLLEAERGNRQRLVEKMQRFETEVLQSLTLKKVFMSLFRINNVFVEYIWATVSPTSRKGLLVQTLDSTLDQTGLV